MGDYLHIMKSLVPRGAIALFLLLAGVSLLFNDNPYGVVLIILGAVIVAKPLARLIAESAGSLFYSRERFSGPLPMYGIPASKRARGDYEEAIAYYEKMIIDYPNEVRPYTEMIDIAIRDLKDPERALKLYQRGVLILKSDEDKEFLARVYSAVRTRLNAKPSN